MVSRLADRILSAVLPQTKAAAPCGPSYLVPCHCSGGLRKAKSCRDCTGQAPPCSPCNIVTGAC